MENSLRGKKRALEDLAADPDGECDTDAHGIVASTSALTASAPNVKRGTTHHTRLTLLSLITPNHMRAIALLRLAKRAETRECPICGDHIPLRLLGQHYTLESARVQTILDHIGDLDAFSDPHAPPHAPYVPPSYTQTRVSRLTGPSRAAAPPLLRPLTSRASPRPSAPSSADAKRVTWLCAPRRAMMTTSP
jgi:hypothetical protein